MFPEDSKADGAAMPASRLGRKRDPTRDAAILDAALEVLSEVDYAGMTMDMVALRAKAGKATVYRRWSSKEELVLDAVARLVEHEVSPADVPDTGTWYGDLVALMRPQAFANQARRVKVMGGLASILASHPELAGAASASVHPWVEANRVVLRRALERGEIDADANVETLAHILPAMVSYRLSVDRKSVDRKFLLAVIDGALVPALRKAR